MNNHPFANRITSLIFILLVGGVIFLPPVLAQTENTKNDKDKTLRSNARVNPSTLAMEFSLPITGLSGRASNSLGLSLEYSSKVWGSNPDTFFNGAGSRTNVTAKFAERSSAGWNSTLDVPRLSVENTASGLDTSNETEIYKTDGTSWKESSDGSRSPDNFSLVYVSRIRITMPSGATSELRRDDGYAHAHGAEDSHRIQKSDVYYGTYLSTDGTKMRLELSWASNELRSVLYMPDGSRYLDLPGEYAISRDTVFIDRHGNKMTYNSGTRLWTDTLGRSIQNPLISDLYSEPAAGTQTYYYPGFGSQPQQYQLVWENLNTQHSTLAYLSPGYCLGTYFTQIPGGSQTLFATNGTTTRFCGSSTTFNPVVLTEVRLPGGMTYKFKYNLYGEIEKIEYPTGGYERFEYSYFDPISSTSGPAYDQMNRGVKKRWISVDGVNELAPWEYDIQKETTSTQNGPYRVKTIAPDGTWSEQLLKDRYSAVSAKFGFDDASIGRSYEDRTYAAPSTQENLLKRHLTKWTHTGPLTIGGVTGHQNATRDLRPEKEITIVFEPNETQALATMTETVYDTGDSIGSTDPAYFSSLNAKQTKTYHYIALSAANAESWTIDQIAALFSTSDVAVVTETDYLYDANYKARNISGLATETRIKDAGGTVKAKSQISYDETSYALSSTGTMPTAAAASWIDLTDTSQLGATIGSKRGLPTTVKSYSDLAVNPNAYIETHSFYDQYGNLRKARDGRGSDTEMQYDAVYAFAYPTKTITPPNSASVSFETSVVYNYNTGLPTSTTDANNQTTQMSYADPVTSVIDPLYRIRKVTAPNGHQTITEYGVPDVTGTLPTAQRFVKVKTQIDDVKWKEGYSWYDGIGRTYKSQSVDSSGDVFALTCYDNVGRVEKVSNPFKNVSNPTCASNLEWTTNIYDAATGRLSKVKTPDAAEVETNYGLAATGNQLGTTVTVKDQALKERRSITNALGQLTRVDEPDVTNSNLLGSVAAPYQPTVYAYDKLNNLVSVDQGTAQANRTFAYDSLSRLKQATNPESGTISYTYDANGNLQTKRDARGIKTIYDYDNLNRVTNRCYRDIGTSAPLGMTTCANNTETAEANTPTVTYTYDGVTNAKGKLTKVSSAASETEYTAFDVMGRVLAHKQTTAGTSYTTGYVYNLSGALIEETYPSTRVVKNVLDNDGDLSIVQSKKNANTGYWNYADSFTYTAAGAVSSMQLGNGKWESTTFNSRLQPTQIALGTVQNGTDKLKLDFTYNTTGQNNNNGNILSQTITVPTVGTTNGFTATQNYAYDSLNRLKSAEETISNTQTWKQTFQYDRYGNRTFDEANTTASANFPKNCGGAVCSNDVPIYNPTIDVTKNRLVGYTYDAAGNTTKDAQSRKFTYDGENKQTKVETVNGSGTVTGTVGEYFYDGDGKRVKKIAGSEVTIFVYDAAGKLVAEYANQTSATPQVSYLTNDHLGSPRINTDANGAVISRHDYQPFGEEIQRTGYGNDDVRKQFTGYERDDESELSYAINRYHSSAHGRFTSVDPYNIILEKEKGRDEQEKLSILIAYISDPQLWGKYSYAVNNPLKHKDPDGRRPVTAADKARIDSFVAFGNARADEIAAAGDQATADAFRQAVDRAATGLYQAIEAISNNAKQDPTNLRALWGAIDELGDKSWGQTTKNGGGEKSINSNGWKIYTNANDNKCNVFVAAVYALNNKNIHGAGIGLLSSGTPNGFPVNAKFASSLRLGANGNLPTSAEVFSSGLANFNSTNSPNPGDIVANGHHLGIYVGHEIVISATDSGGVRTGPMGTTLSKEPVEYKYYTYGKP